jgi:hypothetical protein
MGFPGALTRVPSAPPSVKALRPLTRRAKDARP